MKNKTKLVLNVIKFTAVAFFAVFAVAFAAFASVIWGVFLALVAIGLAFIKPAEKITWW